MQPVDTFCTVSGGVKFSRTAHGCQNSLSDTAAALTCSSLRLAEEAEAAAAAGAAGEAGSEGCTVSDISDSQPARFSVSCVSRICRHWA